MRKVLLTSCVFGVLVVVSPLSAPDATGVVWNARADGKPLAYVTKDFVRDFDATQVRDALAASARREERAGGVALPGIFLHPEGLADAAIAYPNTALPQGATTRHFFLVFRIGFRDGVPWDTDKGARANGVRFMVGVNGDVVFSEEFAGIGWQARAVDMAPWQGQEVTIEFRTSAVGGNTSYDWCVFGQPMLVSLPTQVEHALESDAVGLGVAQVTCQEDALLTLKMGTAKETVALRPGSHWVPLHFAPGPAAHTEPVLEVRVGAATLDTVLAAPYDSLLSEPEMALSTPLVTAGKPFSVLFSTENIGLGVHTYAETIQLGGSAGLTGPTGQSFTIGRLAPGESQTLRWDHLVAAQPGDWDLRAGPNAEGPGEVRFHAFGPEPATPAEHAEGAQVAVSAQGAGGESIAATVGNGWSRVCLVAEEGYAYGIAETWNGTAWQRTGSLYPLAKVVVAGSGALDCKVEAIETDGDSLVVRVAAAEPARGDARPTGWRATLRFTPDAHSPRIQVRSELVAPRDADLLAFCGPTVLAGDRAYGAKKDFAIFPGLEYLEGDEASSSERDLAPPLNDRRVPAVHKIAAPLMGVQGDGALVALLWNANREWAAGERHAAARFLAPELDGGREYIHMSLFAPSVGAYVKENEYEAAEHPYPIKKGETLTLDMRLVLDHKARYAGDRIVHGPHKGGLVLEAMQHWFDVYGLPEPSPQPRPWDQERALCRDAYLNAVWHEEAQGWSHCHGWDPMECVGFIVPLMLDLRAGVGEPDRSEIQRRIDVTLERSFEKHGKHYLWTGACCHTVLAELPFLYGYLGESMRDFKRSARDTFSAREHGRWVWRTSDPKRAALGVQGGHTLGQAASASYRMLRAARMTGDTILAVQAFEAMQQMEQYEVPRGAQMWECPLYQPDILAAAYAIRAYCEAYRLTGEERYLDHARYWARTGLPFIYMWDLEGYPTMRGNVISVIGSTFYTHSWLGLPVVWCGLVYAYALQDLAEVQGAGAQGAFDWPRIAQMVTTSAMWQQYTEGPSKGTYPDSWNMVKNKPNPADISPENIFMNEFRLRGQSPEIRCARLERNRELVMLNSAANILDPRADKAVGPTDGTIRFALRGATDGPTDGPTAYAPSAYTAFSLLAQVPEPKEVTGAGARVADSDALQSVVTGWLYDAELRGVIMKHQVGPEAVPCAVTWE